MAYPEDKERLEKRDEELKAERMDAMCISIHAQWDKNNPYHEDFVETKYASGRVTNFKFDDPNKITTTWDRVRERLFAFWDKG